MATRKKQSTRKPEPTTSAVTPAKPVQPAARTRTSEAPQATRRSSASPRQEPKAATPESAAHASAKAADPASRFSDYDLFLFGQGNHYQLYEKLGAHPTVQNGVAGTQFAVWAPNANRVSVIGDFNDWSGDANPLESLGDSGIWLGFVPGVMPGALYKYRLVSNERGYTVEKADPFAFRAEPPPNTASIVHELDYVWGDGDWWQRRREANKLTQPWSVYEVHLGSWRRGEGDRFLTYRELARDLVAYVQDMGFTHVEFMPVAEYPFYGSWGYQATGYFAPTSRFGTPEDFMALVDALHRAGISVILDWVPSHFPTDEFALNYFDGTHLYEHADSRKGFHPEWKSSIFNYGRNEVKAFLVSSALFWVRKYHIDALRVDGVASMLYLDYARPDGEWIANEHGGKENLEAIHFLRTLNETIYKNDPDAQTIAEESTAWPMVSRPTYMGGLGFGMKWNMGWMHDTLNYFAKDPIHRKYHHNELTFSMIYAYTENYMLPLSHDEVVHGKGSLISRMPGDDWQKFANLRLLLGYMYAHPGKKMLFMGAEFGQWQEWRHDYSLDWHLLEGAAHAGVQRFVRDLNRLYRATPALYEIDFEPAGFEWIDNNDREQSVLSFMRKDRSGRQILCVANFTPTPRHAYRVGVPRAGSWHEIMNGDAAEYGGSGMGNGGTVSAEPVPMHGRGYSLSLTLPPLAIVMFRGPDMPAP